jgi:hypothetical protein
MTSTTLRITRRGRFVLATLIAVPVVAVSLLVTSPGALAESTPASNDFDYGILMSDAPELNAYGLSKMKYYLQEYKAFKRGEKVDKEYIETQNIVNNGITCNNTDIYV